MGLILMPIFLLALGLIIYNAFLINRLHESELLENKVLFFGFLITIFIYGMIVLSYFLEGRIYALSPYFRIPIFMIILPSFVGFIGKNIQNQSLKIISQSLMASTLVSGFLILILNNYIIHFIGLLGLEVYY